MEAGKSQWKYHTVNASGGKAIHITECPAIFGEPITDGYYASPVDAYAAAISELQSNFPHFKFSFIPITYVASHSSNVINLKEILVLMN